MEPTPELPGLPQPPYHPLVTNNSPAPLRNSGLLLQVKYPRLQFVPFYAFFLCLLPSPTRSAETHMPAIHHQNRQLRIPPLRLAFLGHLLEPLLHLFFSSAAAGFPGALAGAAAASVLQLSSPPVAPAHE